MQPILIKVPFSIHLNHKIIILFLDKSNGWYQIAWAFLKLVGKNNTLNINSKLRLQLYRPNRSAKNRDNKCQPYFWWRSRKLQKYPSTLHITIKGINPRMLLDTFSLKHENKTRRSLHNENVNFNEEKDVTLNGNKMNWDKLLHRKCQLPNSILNNLECYEEGCFIAKFSNAGHYLAYSILLNSTYTIIIYSVSLN